jgi:predicted PurR-regulated permease PerM
MSRRAVAFVMVGMLGVLIAAASMPFALGLLGAPVLAVTFAPLHARLMKWSSPRVAASGVVVVAILAIVLPAAAVTGLLVRELPPVLAGDGMTRLIAELGTLRVGPLVIGEELATMGGDLATWISRQTIALIGSATFIVINLFIALLGTFYLLLAGDEPWRRVATLLPFSSETAEHMRTRFHDVTRATLLGIGVTAVLQGSVIGVTFALLGIDRPLLWAVVTGVVSILPVVGSALVWGPATLFLAVEHRFGAAGVLATIGFVVASNVDNVARPAVFKRISNIHPVVTVVGAFAGMRYFGLLGLLLGPLALVYFLELAKACEMEYGFD